MLSLKDSSPIDPSLSPTLIITLNGAEPVDAKIQTINRSQSPTGTEAIVTVTEGIVTTTTEEVCSDFKFERQ